MSDHERTYLIGLIILILAVIFIIRRIILDRSYWWHHLPPSPSVHKAEKVGKGYIKGIYHCENCNFAGHFFTTGTGPCHYCLKKMHKHTAKWSKIRKIWIFKEDKHEG